MKDHGYSIRVIAESELIPVTCEECGTDNVFITIASCVTCAGWRALTLAHRPELAEMVHLYDA